MPPKQKKKAKGLPKRTGKKKPYRTAYYQYRYPVNKLSRILRRNGLVAARAWAHAHGYESVFVRLARRYGLLE